MSIHNDDYIFGRKLEHPILGKHYYEETKMDYIPQVAPIVLDSGLPFIPVYIHFLMFNLEPVVRPQTPEVLQYFKADSTHEEKSKHVKQMAIPSWRKISNHRSKSDSWR